MRYVGLDLAWGLRNPTGVAVLDAEARLVHLAAVRTDDEIVEEVAAHVEGPCLVSIDAPLIVVNATGSRPAEQQLSADFRRFEAGAHPSNTGKSELAEGSRGLRICQRLGLDVDPRSGRERRGIEVYPHPATVVLFGLSRTLKYKNKRGRTVELMRGELLRLVEHVETVVDTSGLATWAELRRDVDAATRKSELRRAEDQVDAVVCAYVGWFADRWPDRTTVYGDLATGYIVTPALRDETAVVRDAVQQYAARREELVLLGERSARRVVALLDDAGINYLSVSGRTKSIASFAEKAARRDRTGRPLFDDPLVQVTDQVGLRVITYVHRDVAAVADLLGQVGVVHDDRDMGVETASEGRFGYASRHLLVAIGEDPQPVQVQIRTVLQHAWAEFEHDIRYKGVVPAEHASDFDRRFTLAAGLLELADREFTEIRDALRATPRPAPTTGETDDPRLDPRELAVYLAGQYPEAGWSRDDHYAWISGLLLELGLTSFDELGDLLGGVDEALVAARMDYRYPPGAVRRLDDALLSATGERYLALHGNAHRVEALAARLARLRGESA